MRTSRLIAGVAGCALALSQASANLIINGDFQAGDTGFATDYTTPGIGLDGNMYSIVNNPNGAAPLQHPLATPYFDHTKGDATGLMMAVNGSGDASKRVWSQTVSSLIVGLQYEFSLWVSTWYSDSPAVLDIKIDGLTQISLTAPSTTASWVRHSFLWTPASTSAGITAIYDDNTTYTGNDFALDDISLVAVPEPATMIAGALLLLPFGASTIRFIRKNRTA